MPIAQQPSPTVQNHFQAGLKTEFTGLNFPDNAATDTQNCVYTIVGDVLRREGIDYEPGFNINDGLNFADCARSSFRWLNAGGDGESQILVVQVGVFLNFWLTSATTEGSPISANYISQQINIAQFKPQGNTRLVQNYECQYATGNGYLFVFHPDCDPFYCTYSPAVAGVAAPVISAQPITLQIRDLVGIPESGLPNFRPSVLTAEHLYNLLNQGWTQGSGWTGVSTIYSGGLPLSNVNPTPTFSVTMSSQSSNSVLVVGDEVSIILTECAGTGSNPHNNGAVVITATVNGISGLTLFLTATSNSNPALNATGLWSGGNFAQFPSPANLTLVNQGFITTWVQFANNYPSNADVWWVYKNTSDAFSPSTTAANVQPLTTPAPKGVFLMNPFNQDRSSASSVGGLTPVSTTFRPSTGTFYQGRVWYAGVNDSQTAQGDEPYVTWTENIYFSQIIESPANFGLCYQTNDPTSQTLFDLLPSDGGVITIPGCGAVYKLFPLRFGLLVFAANGIWFISGSSGIGFTASDFSVTKISSIQAISGSSFIDVQGYPFFWNQEGIYQVTPSSQPGSAHSPDIQLDVQNMALGTILQYYNNVPDVSKPFARGDYDPINYIVQWCFRSTSEQSLIDRYTFDTILNYNIVTKAFYPYVVPAGITTIVNPNGQFTITSPIISDIKYVNTPGGMPQGNNLIGVTPTGQSPPPAFKYITQTPANSGLTFSQEYNTNYIDFFSNDNIGINYISYFVTGYNLPGQALRKLQTPYVYFFSRNPDYSQCVVQAIWDWVNTATFSGKQSTRQTITMKNNQFYRKIRLRGRGLAVQLKVSSVAGQPFDLMGWSVWNEVNTNI